MKTRAQLVTKLVLRISASVDICDLTSVDNE